MSPTTPTAFEERVIAGLHKRADGIAAPPEARAAIDRRIAQRARSRRIRDVALASILAIVVLAGTIAIVQRGHDDASVVTVPGVPAVHLPQLGLPPNVGTTRIMNYVPGRQMSSLLLRGAADGSSSTATANLQGQPDGDGLILLPILGAALRLVVTDASLDEFAHGLRAISPPERSTINDQEAATFTVAPGTDDAKEVVIWQASPNVIASLSVAVTTVSEPLGAKISLLAAGLVELDDTTWWDLLNPTPPPSWLGLIEPDGIGEVWLYGPDTSGGSLLQVLDTPDWAPGTFQLVSGPADTPDSAVPENLAGTRISDIVVRGIPGVMTTAPRAIQADPVFAYSHSLVWVEGGLQHRLDFKDAATPEGAVTVAERLSALTSDEWHELLFPSTVRTDLVPMPRVAD